MLADLYCACGYFEEDVIFRVMPHCPDCGTQLKRKLAVPRLIGPTDTKPLTLGGRTYTSSSAMNRELTNHSVLTASEKKAALVDMDHKIEKNYDKVGGKKKFEADAKRRAAEGR